MCFDGRCRRRSWWRSPRHSRPRGVDQLWVIEDCFYTAGISLAATALARTESLTVGIGILPAVARNPAVTAMEIATLAKLAPGRLLAGIGHGVQEWMDQMGAAPRRRSRHSMRRSRSFAAAARRDGHVRGIGVHDARRGARCAAGRSVHRCSPASGPEVAGARRSGGRRRGARRGRGPTYVAQSIEQAGSARSVPGVGVHGAGDRRRRRETRRAMAPFVAGLLDGANPAPKAHPHIDEIRERTSPRRRRHRRHARGLVDRARARSARSTMRSVTPRRSPMRGPTTWRSSPAPPSSSPGTTSPTSSASPPPSADGPRRQTPNCAGMRIGARSAHFGWGSRLVGKNESAPSGGRLSPAHPSGLLVDRSTTGRTSGVSLRLDLFTSPVSPCGAAGDAAFRTRHRFPGLEPVGTASR